MNESDRKGKNRRTGLLLLAQQMTRRSTRLAVQITCVWAMLILLSVKAAAQPEMIDDCNGNGVPDERDVLPGSFGFAPQAIYTAGAGLIRVGALDWRGEPVDLNNDQYPDLLTTNKNSNTVSVLMNRRDGTFERARSFKAGQAPLNLLLADFDQDDRVDVAVSSFMFYSFSVLRNTGKAGFQMNHNYPLKDRPTWMHAADLNADGRPDIVLSYWTTPIESSIAVFLNTASGFQLHTVFGPELMNALNITSGDFDNDGDVDLVALRAPFPAVVLFNNRGDGTFLPGVDYKLTFEQANIVPDGVIAADLDNDGDLDLAVSVWADESRGWGDLRILENRGNGTFRSYVDSFEEYGPMRYPIIGLANDVIAGDFDNDGLLDIAMPVTDYRGSNVVIMRNQGNLQFGPPAYFPVMHRPLSITAADFNLDGILDIATANFEDSDTVSVLLGQTTGPPFSNDCNFNGVPDECDVAGDSSTDTNENGVPDECERCIGDYNLSGFVDWVDANGHPQFYGCEVGVGLWWCDEADIDGDGQVNPADVGVIRQHYGVCP